MVTKTFDEIIQSFLSFILRRNDLIDIKPTALTRTLLDSVANELAVVNNELDNIRSIQTILNADTMSVQEMDNLAANFGVSRKSAAFATVPVTFRLSREPRNDITIPEGTQLSTATDPTLSTSVPFVTTQTITMFANRINSYFSPTSGFFEITTTAKALVPGSAGNIPANTLTRTVGTLNSGSDIVVATNLEAAEGGADQESNTDLAARVFVSISGINVGTKDGYKSSALAVPGVTDCLVVGAGDDMMVRDLNSLGQHIGGRVDVYIEGQDPEAAQDRVAFALRVKRAQKVNLIEGSNLEFSVSDPDLETYPLVSVDRVYTVIENPLFQFEKQLPQSNANLTDDISITIVTPLSGSTVDGGINVLVRAFEPDGRIVRVDLIINSEIENQMFFDDSIGLYNFSLNTAQFKDGLLQLQARATDDKNNIVVTGPIFLHVKNLEEILVRIMTPDAGSTITMSRDIVVYAYSIVGMKPRGVEIRFNNGRWIPMNPDAVPTKFTFPLVASNFKSGAVKIEVRAKDNRQRTAYALPRFIIVENGPAQSLATNDVRSISILPSVAQVPGSNMLTRDENVIQGSPALVTSRDTGMGEAGSPSSSPTDATCHGYTPTATSTLVKAAATFCAQGSTRDFIDTIDIGDRHDELDRKLKIYNDALTKSSNIDKNCADLNQTQKALETALTNANATLAAANTRKKQIDSEFGTASAVLDDAKRRVEQHQSEVNILNERISSLITLIADIIPAAQRKVDQIVAARMAAEAIVAAKKEEWSGPLQSAYEKLTGPNSPLDLARTKLINDLFTLKDHLRIFKEQGIDISNSAIIAEDEARIEADRTDVAAKEAPALVVSQKIIEAKAEQDKAQIKANELYNQTALAEDAVEAAKTQKVTKETELADARNFLEVTQRDLNEATSDMIKAQATIDSLKTQKETATSEQSDAEAAQKLALQNEIDGKNSIKLCEEKARQAEKDMKDASDAVEEAKHALDRLTEEQNNKSLSVSLKNRISTIAKKAITKAIDTVLGPKSFSNVELTGLQLHGVKFNELKFKNMTPNIDMTSGKLLGAGADSAVHDGGTYDSATYTGGTFHAGPLWGKGTFISGGTFGAGTFGPGTIGQSVMGPGDFIPDQNPGEPIKSGTMNGTNAVAQNVVASNLSVSGGHHNGIMLSGGDITSLTRLFKGMDTEKIKFRNGGDMMIADGDHHEAYCDLVSAALISVPDFSMPHLTLDSPIPAPPLSPSVPPLPSPVAMATNKVSMAPLKNIHTQIVAGNFNAAKLADGTRDDFTERDISFKAPLDTADVITINVIRPDHFPDVKHGGTPKPGVWLGTDIGLFYSTDDGNSFPTQINSGNTIGLSGDKVYSINGQCHEKEGDRYTWICTDNGAYKVVMDPVNGGRLYKVPLSQFSHHENGLTVKENHPNNFKIRSDTVGWAPGTGIEISGPITTCVAFSKTMQQPFPVIPDIPTPATMPQGSTGSPNSVLVPGQSISSMFAICDPLPKTSGPTGSEPTVSSGDSTPPLPEP